MRLYLVLTGTVMVALAVTTPALGASVNAGPLVVEVQADPWAVTLSQRGGAQLLERGGVGYRDGSGWHRATRARSLVQDGNVIAAVVETEGGEDLTVLIEPGGDGVLRTRVAAPAGAQATGQQFVAEPGERFFGTGERSDAVARNGRETENYVSDGPFRPEDRQYVAASTPPWAARDRDDATYFPIPWVLSGRGWGVLVDEDATSRSDAGSERADRWGVDVDGALLRTRIFAGPTPAAALARFTAAVGRQPAPQAPWTFGPWFQTGQPNVIPPAEEAAIIKAQRDAGVSVSVGETQMHHLPCGAHEDRRTEERERTAMFHRNGLARLVYFNGALCLSYTKVYRAASAAGVLQKGAGGQPFLYPAFVGGSGPLGFTQEPLAQFDFSNPETEAFYGKLIGEAVDSGADGWMEDFGESTPVDGVTLADGTSGSAAHNRYPTDYHCTVQRIAEKTERPLVRFQRSGWTGSARCAEVVWGGDPTTVYGFDGLSSVVTQALSIGLSGVARYGTDIGGYNSFGAGTGGLKPGETEDETLTPELLKRWIELGALLPVMRTKRSGIALPSYDRPQVFDPEILPTWKKLTALHQQLNPYLRAADEQYRRTGLPIVRHLMLAHPELREAQAADDQFLLGDDLLVAPVTAPEVTERKAYLPPGRWVDFWRSVGYDEASTAYTLGRAEILEGGSERTLPAPLGEPPLLLQVGAVVPLLDPAIRTLTDYGHPGVTRLADRERRATLLAVPRGTTFRRLGPYGSARSIERRGRWILRVRSKRRQRLAVEASLLALRRPLTPQEVLVNGKRLSRKRWSFSSETGVLTLTVRGALVRVEARSARVVRERRRR
ncbi:MAG: glycoside hydrolase family 31 protein [Solirubrobacterales bacterium]|nr:glycoside hydrolase family 31 protein [Solirubrobacterales bacterium]